MEGFVRSRRVAVGDSGHAHAFDCGHGEPVVLLHGLGGIALEMLLPLHVLAARYRVVAVDRPGYGGSSPLPRPADARTQARWLGLVLGALGLRDAVVVAHSIAALPALLLARARPDLIRGLVLVTPFCRPTRPAAMPALRLAVAPVIGRSLRRMLPVLAPRLAPLKLARMFPGGRVPAHLRRLPFAQMAKPDAVLAMADELTTFSAVARQLAFQLRRIETPAVIVAGGRDEVAPPDRHAAWLASRLPRATGVCLQRVGHMAHHVRPRLVALAVEAAFGAPVPHGTLRPL